MSAYVVSKRHVDLMVKAALAARGQDDRLRWWTVDGETGEYTGWRELYPTPRAQVVDGFSFSTPSELGQMLLDANVRSVLHRYREEGDAEEDDPIPYVYEDGLNALTPGQVFRAIDTLDYQCCETDDWQRTETYSFLRSLRKAYCDRVADAENAPYGDLG